MRSGLSRRGVITLGGSAALLPWALGGPGGLVRLAFGQTAPTPGAVRLNDRLIQLSGFGGNVVIAVSGDGVAMVDSGAAEHQEALLDALGEETGGAPVQALLNTHWHLPHTGANAAIGAAGAKIYAHENTRLWMSTQFYVRWEDRTYASREAGALPTETFYSSDAQPLSLAVGDLEIEYGQLENAHTDGDIYVMFPNDNVIVAGGAVQVGHYPIPDFATGGWIDGLIDSTRKLIDIADAETLIVPARGPAQRREHLVKQLDMVSTLRDRIAERMVLGKSAAEMMDENITDNYDTEWGGRELARVFVSNSYEDLAWRGPGGSL